MGRADRGEQRPGHKQGRSRSGAPLRPQALTRPGPRPQPSRRPPVSRIHEATIQIVAERGYRNLEVRDIVALAEVSTRASYEHFASKEDCFLQTSQLTSRRATGRIIAAQPAEPDWRQRPRLIFEAFVEELEREPTGTRLALIDAYTAGQAALAEAWRAERTFEGMLAEVFSRTPRGVVVPPLIVQGMVAGVATVSRKHLLAGRALCYPSAAATELASLDSQSVWRDTTLEPLPVSEAGPGDRALILAATAKLAAKGGYSALTAPRVRAAAHISRKKFDAYFDGVEDCYFAADEFLAKVCLEDDSPSGLAGRRSRKRLSVAISELLGAGAPRRVSSHPLAQEASAGAIWTLFHRHVLRSLSRRSQISATLSYLALAPGIGAPAVVAAIQSEQKP